MFNGHWQPAAPLSAISISHSTRVRHVSNFLDFFFFRGPISKSEWAQFQAY